MTDIRIPLSIPFLGDDDRKHVLDAIDTGWVSSAGPDIARFEDRLAEICGARRVVATASGTAAIHLALLACGVEPGDLVIAPPLTFIGTINPIRYCGADVVFIDVRASDGTLDPDLLNDYLRRGTETANGVLVDARSRRRLRAVLPVHLFGAAAELDALIDLARDHGLQLVEDAAESLGTTYKGRPVGAIGDVGCLSFNGNKIVTTGGGGAVVTNDDRIAEQARYLGTQARDDPSEYVHRAIGFNYRLTNLQAALGIGQLSSISERLSRKRAFAARYRNRLAGLPLRFLDPQPSVSSNYWLNAVILDAPEKRPALLRHLRDDGIEARAFFVPVDRQAPYAESLKWGQTAVADHLYDAGVNLPSSVGLSDADISVVCDSVQRFFEARA